MENIIKKIIVFLMAFIVGFASFFFIANWATNPQTHEHSIVELDNKVDTVLRLTAGAAAASAAISLLPDDQCTPIAQELAEMTKYFLVALSALYLEKYLVTVLGYASFKIIIPLACAIWFAGFITAKDTYRKLSYKLVVSAIAIFLIVPTSVKVSDLIYDSYQVSIQATIDEAEAFSDKSSEPDSTINRITDWITDKAQTVIRYVTEVLSSFMESLAIMIVTSCLVPIVVLIFYVWVIKMLFVPEHRLKLPPKLNKLLESKIQ